MDIRFFICLAICTVGQSFVQELTIYSELNCQGEALVLTTKQPDLTPYSDFLNDSKSYSWMGHWVFYRNINYTSVAFSAFAPWLECENGGFANISSLRYCGPSNTKRMSVSLYKDVFVNQDEVTVEGEAANISPPFVPVMFLTTGVSNWTLYSESNYSGNSVCLVSFRDFQLTVASPPFSVASVVRDCLKTDAMLLEA